MTMQSRTGPSAVPAYAKTSSQVLTFRAETECVRCGGDVKNWRDLHDATQRVLKADPVLARAYFSAPNDSFASGGRS